jgi:aryl-alcohol dehydrogenase-like predicted oxidoreductase
MRALDDQVRAGTVLSVGISNAPSWMIGWANAVATVRGWSPFAAVQNEYNLLQRGAERELLPMTRYLGLAYLAWAPIAQGRLTGKYSADGTVRRLNADEARMSPAQEQVVAETLTVAKELDCSPATVALRWILDHQPKVIPVIGARSFQQFSANLGCLDLRLSTGQLERLTAASAIDPGSPAGFLRSAPGRDFMWGNAAPVPLQTTPAGPWWEP